MSANRSAGAEKRNSIDRVAIGNGHQQAGEISGTISRRTALSALGALGALGVAGFGAAHANAAETPAASEPSVSGAPPAPIKIQAPGFYRQRVGQTIVTVVSDGLVSWPLTMAASDVPDAQVKALLRANFLDTEAIAAHLNTCIIETPDARILIDAGAGADYQASSGRLIANLEAAGYAASDIDLVVLTQGHIDHCGGLVDLFDGSARFPRADYVMMASEWDFWTGDQAAAALKEPWSATIEKVRAQLLPLSARVNRLQEPGEIAPGVTLAATPGTTLGQVSVIVDGGTERLMVTGDAVSHALISFEHPEWRTGLDFDAKTAAATRTAVLEQCAAEGLLVLGYHLPFPGFGRVGRRGRSYRWVPSLWTWEV